MKILTARRAAMLALACLVLFPSFAVAGPRVAVLELENRSGDPRYDYLGGIVQGLLLYDLSSSGSVELLDRGSIAALLEERELSLSSIAAAQARSFEGISTADYIVAGEYVLLGTELRLTFKLVDVATSRVATFSDSGSTENLVHGLAEALVERLTGKRPALREEGRSRSLLSLRDETPGSIALFSPLIDAQVLLDGEFVGYTIGDRRVPFEEGRLLAGLVPGARLVTLETQNHILLPQEPAFRQFFDELEAFVPRPPGARKGGAFSQLTAREAEVLERIAQGLDNAQIAARLGISEKTVRNNITHIFDKLAVDNRSQAIVLARDNGFGQA